MIRAIVLAPVRAVGRRAEGLALSGLDALLASQFARTAVARALEGPLVEAVARDVVRYAVLERLAAGIADDPALERIVGRALESPATERMLVRVLESKLMDEAVRRVLDGEELWLVVDEVAQSPAVTEAITRQSVSFADQVAGQVRDRSRNADARLERAARRVLRRDSAPGPEEP